MNSSPTAASRPDLACGIRCWYFVALTINIINADLPGLR